MGRWPILVVIGVLVLAWSIPRDIRYSRDYPGDLRYRIVGARLVRDGRLPYAYKWAKGDGFRYYDPDNFDSLKAANITVSPFYLHVLAPLTEFPQSTLIWIWLVSEYLLLAAMAAYCWRIADGKAQKKAVLGFALLFLLTNAWKHHVYVGQTYLWIPFLAMLFYAGIRRPGNAIRGLAAGAVAAFLVFYRVNTLFFLLPFLLLLPRYDRRWIGAFFLPALLLTAWTLSHRHERDLWQQYAWMSQQYLDLNQELGPQLQHNEPDPGFAHWEGIDSKEANRLTATEPNPTYSENGNVFVLLRFAGIRMSYRAIGIAALCIMAILLGWFYSIHRPMRRMPVDRLAIFAFCLYMISDLFSPIYRHQYYTVQWFFPLLLAAATWGRPQRRFLWALVVCLVILAVHLPFVKMQNTVAEYAIMAVLLGFALFARDKPLSKASPASGPIRA